VAGREGLRLKSMAPDLPVKTEQPPDASYPGAARLLGQAETRDRVGRGWFGFGRGASGLGGVGWLRRKRVGPDGAGAGVGDPGDGKPTPP
jgi:hypothetical protein